MTVVAEKKPGLMLIPGYDPYRDSEGYYFDADEANACIKFFPRYLKHAKGKKAGKAFELEDWQKCVVANLFGWKSEETGLRRYREALIYIAKKNGKTAWASGMVLLFLHRYKQQGGEIYSAAASAKQAEIVFQHVRGMIQQQPAFEKKFKVYGKSGAPTFKAVNDDATDSFYRCLASDAERIDGIAPTLNIIDELHRHAKRDLTDVLVKSTAERAEPMTIYTTTADYNRPSLCNETRKYAIEVRDGIRNDPQFLPVIYEIHEDDDYGDPAVWRKANPNLDVTLEEPFLARELAKARAVPAQLNNFLRLHLNLITDSAEAWIPGESWDKLTPIDPDELIGCQCHMGIDLSSTTDLTAVVLVFPLPDDEVAILPAFWIPTEGAKRRQDRDRVPYLTWAREGFLDLTPGNCVDYERVRKYVNECADNYDVLSVGIDRWNATQLTTQLTDDGFETFEFRQTYTTFNPPSKEFERLVLEKRLRPVTNPILRWNLANVVAEMDHSGNIKPSRKKSTEKIDGIVAALMGIGRLLESEDGGNVYDKRGFLRL